jgi:hypothetical protein
MKEELRFNWLDVFRAPRIALSLQKIGAMFLPLLIGYLSYVCFTFCGLAASGSDVLQKAWERSGLLPCAAAASSMNVGGYILWMVGVVCLLASVLFAGTAVARAAFLELKGETFFTLRDLYGFARKNLKSVLLGPLGILAVIAGIVLCGIVVGLVGGIYSPVGLIPVVGLSPLWLGISFFLIALSVVFVFCVLLAPAITATSRGDFFEVITETFSLTFSEPYRLVGYQAVLAAVAGVAISILGFFVKLAYSAMVGILTLGMGDSFQTVSAKACNLMAHWFPGIFHLLERYLGFGIAFRAGFLTGSAGTTDVIAGGGAALPATAAATGYEAFWAYVLAVVVSVAGFLVVACFGAALIAAGNTIVYVVLHKIKDEENLLELEEEEGDEEEGKADEGADRAEAPAETAEEKAAEAPPPPPPAPPVSPASEEAGAGAPESESPEPGSEGAAENAGAAGDEQDKKKGPRQKRGKRKPRDEAPDEEDEEE